MLDLLVRLYDLPESRKPTDADITIRRAFAAEKKIVSAFAANHFTNGWASECEIAFARVPIACFIVVERETIAGFACYDVAARGFFGLIGVAKESETTALVRRCCSLPCKICSPRLRLCHCRARV